MKTYLTTGFIALILGINCYNFAAEEQKQVREPWHLRAEAVLQATHKRLGAQSLFTMVGPHSAQTIATYLKPHLYIINTTNEDIEYFGKSAAAINPQGSFNKDFLTIIWRDNQLASHDKVPFVIFNTIFRNHKYMPRYILNGPEEIGKLDWEDNFEGKTSFYLRRLSGRHR